MRANRFHTVGRQRENGPGRGLAGGTWLSSPGLVWAIARDKRAGRLHDGRPSDIGLPGENGYELLQRIRALPAEEGGLTLAIALTASARAEDRARALRAGFDMHVPKPVEAAELLAVLAAATERLRGG